MPYSNFDDNYATQLLYSQQQKEDPDLTLSEFVFGKLLVIGDIIDKDDDEMPVKLPINNSQPFKPLQIQTGFLESPKPIHKLPVMLEKMDKPLCLFKDNKFTFEYSSTVFHPPSLQPLQKEEATLDLLS